MLNYNHLMLENCRSKNDLYPILLISNGRTMSRFFTQAELKNSIEFECIGLNPNILRIGETLPYFRQEFDDNPFGVARVFRNVKQLWR